MCMCARSQAILHSLSSVDIQQQTFIITWEPFQKFCTYISLLLLDMSLSVLTILGWHCAGNKAKCIIQQFKLGTTIHTIDYCLFVMSTQHRWCTNNRCGQAFGLMEWLCAECTWKLLTHQLSIELHLTCGIRSIIYIERALVLELYSRTNYLYFVSYFFLLLRLAL